MNIWWSEMARFVLFFIVGVLDVLYPTSSAQKWIGVALIVLSVAGMAVGIKCRIRP